jgi:hypothetical protein
VAQRAERVLGGKGSSMTETLVGMSPPSTPQEPMPPSEKELAAARELVRAARDRGVALTGPDGLLKALTKTVVETALDPYPATNELCRCTPSIVKSPDIGWLVLR